MQKGKSGGMQGDSLRSTKCLSDGVGHSTPANDPCAGAPQQCLSYPYQQDGMHGAPQGCCWHLELGELLSASVDNLACAWPASKQLRLCLKQPHIIICVRWDKHPVPAREMLCYEPPCRVQHPTSQQERDALPCLPGHAFKTINLLLKTPVPPTNPVGWQESILESVIKDTIRKAGFHLREVRSSGSCAKTSHAVTSPTAAS